MVISKKVLNLFECSIGIKGNFKEKFKKRLSLKIPIDLVLKNGHYLFNLGWEIML